MNKDNDKIDKLAESVNDLKLEVRTGFERYNQLLDRHIEGVEQNRESVKAIQTQVENHEKHVDKKLEPIVKHVDRVQFFLSWAFKIVGGSGVLAIIGFVIKAILSK